MRVALSDLIPKRDSELIKLLRAVRHVYHYPATETRRGRPARWSRSVLLAVGAQLTALLKRETQGRIGIKSFVDHYLRVLDFPADVQAALTSREINLFEAAQLARLAPQALQQNGGQARRVRQQLLAGHLAARGSGASLRRRVAELLTHTVAVQRDGVETVPERHPGATEPAPEELEDFDPYDATHLFWDQIRQLGFALREIERTDVGDSEIEELLKASEPILNLLARIKRRKLRAASSVKTLRI